MKGVRPLIKFIHTGDLHLGFKFLNPSFKGQTARERRRELWSTFDRIVDYAMDEKVDFLFIAGDLFEEAYFTIGDMKRVRDNFKKAKAVNIIIVAGNHDYIGRKSLYNKVEWTKNVNIFDTNGIGKMEFKDLNTNVYGYSWDTKEIKDHSLFFDLKQNIDKNKNNILILHGDIYGDSNYLPLKPDELKNLNMDYIGLGHIHKPDIIGKNIAYCGSPEPLDFGEIGERGIIEGAIIDKKLDIKFKAFSKRQFLQGSIQINSSMGYLEILDEIKNIDIGNKEKDFYRIELTGFVEKHINLDNILTDVKSSFYHIEICDNTVLDYDLDQLEIDNKDNIIGRFIEAMKEKGQKDPIVKNALYIGLEALLKESN